MTRYSKNKKNNAMLNAIEESLLEMGIDEVKRYYHEFKNENNAWDFNIAQYGNLLIYYDQVREFYRSFGYKCIEKYDNQKLWDTYLKNVGYVVRYLVYNN